MSNYLDHYNLSNALFWGNCILHFKESQNKALSNGRRFAHLGIALIEFLPVVSQICSFTEWFFATKFKPVNALPYLPPAPQHLHANPSTDINFESHLSAPSTNALNQSSISLKAFSKELHALCEIDTDGNQVPCDLNNLQQIVHTLKQHGALEILNQVPKYFLENRFGKKNLKLYTPLQYWAAQGNLDAVKLLIANGAKDSPAVNKQVGPLIIVGDCNGQESAPGESALFAAARYGHIQVVDYLLSQNKATPNIAFGNVLHSFLPRLIFRLMEGENTSYFFFKIFSPQHMECLKLILKNFDDQGVLFQLLQIPVDTRGHEPLNCLEFAKQHDEALYQYLHQGLKDKGIHVISTFKELKNNGFPIGSGHDLGQIASMKRS
jgi:ankyrin repeat protein